MDAADPRDNPGDNTATAADLRAAPAPAARPPSPLDALDSSSLANLRDLGGLPVESGGTTTFGVLYRGDAPRWRDQAPGGVVVWPPRTVIDLRSAAEWGRHPHPLTSDETTVHRVPLLGDPNDEHSRSRAKDALHGGLETLYAAMLDFAAPRLVQVAHLLAEAPTPVLVHCTAGKDRTGLVSALMLRAVGVPGATVIADYSETARNMPAVMRRVGNRSLLPGVEQLGADVTAISNPAAEQVLRVLDGHQGGAHGWLLAAGADQAALTAWRARFVGA